MYASFYDIHKLLIQLEVFIQTFFALFGNLLIMSLVNANFIRDNRSMNHQRMSLREKVECLLDSYKKLKTSLGIPLFLTISIHTVSGTLAIYLIIKLVTMKQYIMLPMMISFVIMEYLILILLTNQAEDTYSHFKDEIACYW